MADSKVCATCGRYQRGYYEGALAPMAERPTDPREDEVRSLRAEVLALRTRVEQLEGALKRGADALEGVLSTSDMPSFDLAEGEAALEALRRALAVDALDAAGKDWR